MSTLPPTVDDDEAADGLVVDVQALAREIAARMDPDALWDSKDVASYIKCAPRHVTEELAGTPGFPAAIRLPTKDGRRGQPRWRRSAIVKWVAACEQGRKPQGGRPRKKVELD